MAHSKTSRLCAVAFATLCLLSGRTAQAQPIETDWFPQVISREYAIHVGGVQTPEYKEIVSREFSVFVGEEPEPPWKQAVSRELSIVVTTPAVPARVSPLAVAPTPTGETVTLSWVGYNQWAESDVARYAIYWSPRPFTSVAALTPHLVVPGETLSVTLTDLPAWQDHFFAVVAVDALDGFDPQVNYAAAYVIAREVVSREFSVFVGDEPDPPWKQAVSREVSIVVTTPAVPARVTSLSAIPTPAGETVALSWVGYNQWAERDVARYGIYRSNRPFTSIAGLTPHLVVPGETLSVTLTDLPAWQDHFFAVVPVDALEGFDPEVNYAAAYVIAREVISREFSVFVGDEPTPPLKEALSREVSTVVSTPEVPAPVTCLGCGFTGRDSVDSFSALDLDWTAYNDIGQKDIVRYRVYLGPTSNYYDDVSALSPVTYVPAETKRCTIAGLVPYGVYFVAVVAEDALGQFNPVVRSQSAQASVDRVREVQDLAATYDSNGLTFTWQPPKGADPHANNLLTAYRVYLDGIATPVELDRFALSYTATDLLVGNRNPVVRSQSGPPAADRPGVIEPMTDPLIGHGYPVRITSVDNLGRESDGASLLEASANLDWGDLPSPPYPTLGSQDGPRHSTLVSWLRLGVSLDSEVYGQPSATATGDDAVTAPAVDDEDGVALSGPVTRGASVSIPITVTGAPGTVNAFIDWNNNGTLNDAGETYTLVFAAPGIQNLTLTVPDGAIMGVPLGARFRVSSAGGLSPTGLAPDGEVEDYLVTVTSPPTAARLAYFNVASTANGAVQLAWGTLVENNVLGFRVDRSTADGGWTRLTAQIIPAAGWNGRPQTYGLVDADAPAIPGLTYRLLETDLSGRERVLALATVEPGLTMGIVRTESGLSLSLRGVANTSVAVETAKAVEGPWTRVHTLALDGSGAGTIDFGRAVNETARFYRVLRE